MLLVALYRLGGQVGVLDIVAILLKLNLVKRRLVASRRRVVSQSQGQNPDKQVIKVRGYRHSV